MDASRPLFIPVILGTARMGRLSLHAAKLVTREVAKHAGVEGLDRRCTGALPAA